MYRLIGVYHHFCGTAVGCDALTIDKVTFGVAQKEAGVGNIFRLADSTGEVEGVVLGSQDLILIDTNPSRRNAVYGDMIWRERHCQSVCQ